MVGATASNGRARHGILYAAGQRVALCCVVPDAWQPSALRRLCRMCDEPVALTPRTAG